MILQQAKSNNRWIYIIIGILIMMLLGTVYSYSIFRVSLEREWQIGRAESGMPYMASLAFYALFMFLTGRYIEKFSAKKVFIFGSILVSIGWILSSFVTNIYLLTITYGVVSGAGVGIAYGVPMTVIAKWFPDKKGIAVGLVLLGFGLSPLITAPVVRYLVENYGLMTMFLISGVSFGVILPILSVTLKYPTYNEIEEFIKKNKNEANSIEIPLKEMIRTTSFKGIYLNFIIGTMIGLMMIGMTTSIGLEYFKLELSTVTNLMAIFAIFNGLGRPIFGWITDSYSLKFSMILSYTLIALSTIGLATLNNHIIVYIITISIFWFNLGGWLAIAPTSTLKLYGIKSYSQNYGLVFTAYGIGAIAGSSTSGMLLDYNGNYHYVFYYILALCFSGILITIKYINKGNHDNRYCE